MTASLESPSMTELPIDSQGLYIHIYRANAHNPLPH